MTDDKEKFAKYPKTEMFSIIDTIGVPHPYCITPKHVAHASDHHGGILDANAIRDAEKHGAQCDICRTQVKKGLRAEVLQYDDHKSVLVVEVRDPQNRNKPTEIPELREYLIQIKAQAESDGYAGFAFKKGKV